MIYLETSVALAHVLAENRAPRPSLWDEPLASSRLLEYELWTRVNAHKLGKTHGEAVRALLSRVSLLELSPLVLTRVVEPFPVAIRTLDAIHLASAAFLRGRGQAIELATYDNRLRAAAEAMGIEIAAV